MGEKVVINKKGGRKKLDKSYDGPYKVVSVSSNGSCQVQKGTGKAITLNISKIKHFIERKPLRTTDEKQSDEVSEPASKKQKSSTSQKSPGKQGAIAPAAVDEATDLIFPAGLQNGRNNDKSWNVCYANSIIQVLKVFGLSWAVRLSESTRAACQLSDFLIRLASSSSALSPEPVLQIVRDRFHLGAQEDASEFFLYLMENVNSPTLEDIIRVAERQHKQCNLCGHT